MSNQISHADNSNRCADSRLHVAYLAINTMNTCSMVASCKDLEWVDIDIRVSFADSSSLENDEETFYSFLDTVRDSDVLLVNSHGDPRSMTKLDRLLSAASENGSRVILVGSSEETEAKYAPLSGLSDEMRREISKYVRKGGEKNNLSALMWLCKNLKGHDVQIPSLSVSVQQGIYLPGKGLVKDEKGFMSTLPSDRPVVAIMFHQGVWLEGNLSPIDALAESIQSQGAFAYPVFYLSMEDRTSGAIGVDAVVKRYLTSSRKSLVDAIVVVGGFSQDSFRRGCCEENVFSQTDVPVIQANILNMSPETWEEGVVPMSASMVSCAISQPELDGQIISVPLCFSKVDSRGNYRSTFVKDRVDRIASLAVRWARLRRTSPDDLKVAVVLNSDRMSQGRAGTASGLDSFESLRRLLMRLSKEGLYVGKVPNSNDIFKLLMRSSCNVSGWSEVPEGHPAIGSAQYRSWFESIPSPLREQATLRWGSPPESGLLPIPGAMFGNVFVGMEPEGSVDVHGFKAVPSHEFCAFYLWTRLSFKADVVVHMGTRGTVEHLPGKEIALSSGCWPDLLMGSVPNLYPFALDDPGEGEVAKRRIASVLIGYLGPPMVRTGLYGDIGEMDGLIQSYMASKASMQPEKSSVAGRRICDLARSAHILHDVCLPPDLSDEAILRHLGEIQDYIIEVKNACVDYGLHVLGSLPKGRALASLVLAATSDGRGSLSPLEEALSRDGSSQDRAREEALELLEAFEKLRFGREDCVAHCNGRSWLLPAVVDICDRVYPALCGVRNELDMLVHGIRGGFVPSGPSGALSSGRMHVLPTGRNICLSDPRTVPTELSWEVGSEAVEAMVRRFARQNGRYPETVAVALNAIDVLGLGGDCLAMALRLMGAKPVRESPDGVVVRVEPIPLAELGRPRIDAEMMASPVATSSLPDVERLIGMAVDAVSALDEPDGQNAVRKHLEEDQAGHVRDGMGEPEALAMAKRRVFVGGRGTRVPDVSVVGISDSLGPDAERMARVCASSGAGSAAIGQRPVSSEIALAVRTRVLNPSWVKGMAEHGADGAGEVSRTVHALLTWALGAGATEGWMFEESFRVLVLDEGVRGWMAACNPFAVKSVCEDLLEASEAGCWDASRGDLEMLRDVCLEAEGTIEDIAVGSPGRPRRGCASPRTPPAEDEGRTPSCACWGGRCLSLSRTFPLSLKQQRSRRRRTGT